MRASMEPFWDSEISEYVEQLVSSEKHRIASGDVVQVVLLKAQFTGNMPPLLAQETNIYSTKTQLMGMYMQETLYDE